VITRDKANILEKLLGQLQGMHTEVTALNKKSPNDAVNRFKLGFINAALTQCNELIGKDYQPLGGFTAFNSDDVPSNSDVSFVIVQYLEALEKFQRDNVKYVNYQWQYDLPKNEPVMRAAAAAKKRWLSAGIRPDPHFRPLS
jgi:hypothetical protein